jgi:fibronectin type 3 domain-containing protein
MAVSSAGSISVTPMGVVNMRALSALHALDPFGAGPHIVQPPMPGPYAPPSGPAATYVPPAPAASDHAKPNTPASAAPSPGISSSFLAAPDNGQWIPPDTDGAVGYDSSTFTKYLVTALNGTVQVQDAFGNVLTSTTLNSFFSVASGNFAFDPNVIYDPNTNRWFMVVGYDTTPATSNIEVMVSQTADPTGSWYRYAIQPDGGNTWSDFPRIGFNKDWITISFNQFDGSNSFVKTRIFDWPKANMEAGAGLTIWLYDDTGGFTIVPAREYDYLTTTEYLLGVSAAAPGSNLRMGTLVGDSTVTPAYTATAGTTVGPSSWTCCAAAPQLGGSATIDNGDTRLQDVIYRNGKLWATHTVTLTSPTVRNAVQWWEIDPTSPSSPVQFGRIDDSTGTNYYAYPSLSVNANNDMMIGYSQFSANNYASAHYAFRAANDPTSTLRNDTLLKSGEAYYFKDFGTGENRWGDFSATQVDPIDDQSFYTIQEYAGSQISGTSEWGTWWGGLNLFVPNDQCGSAFGFGVPPGTGYTFANSQITVDATTTSDPTGLCGNLENGVWYTYTAPFSGTLYLDTFNSDYDTVLAAFSGVCGSLTNIACNDDYGGGVLQSFLNVPVTAGTNYSFLVGGYYGATGTLQFHAQQFVLTAAPRSGQVALNWTPSPIATSYTVLRSTVSGSGYATVASGLGSTSYTNTGLTNGTPYYFVVQSLSSRGTDSSNEAAATPSSVAGGNVLLCGGQMDSTIQSYLGALGHGSSTIVAPASFGSASFSGYSAVWLGEAEGGSITGLSGQANNLISYMNGGGNVFAELAETTNPITDFPYGNQLTAVTGAFIETPHLTDLTSLVNAGLTDAGMSNWFNSIHSYFTADGTFHEVSNDSTNGQSVTLYKQVGAGHLVISGQDPSYHAQYGSGATGPSSQKMTFANNVLNLMPQKPQQVTGLTATPADTKVTLVWNATDGAVAYRVRRSTTNGGPYSTIATLAATTTTYANTGLTNNTTYYYVVAGNNALGDGVNSAQASATPFAIIPPAPTGLTATPGNTTATLRWTAANGASFYRVRRSTTNGGPYTTIATVTATIFGNTGLTNGTTYYYVVAGGSSAGTGPNSNQASTTPMAPPPAPTGVAAAPGSGTGTISVTWSAVGGASGYRVKRSASNGGPYTTVATVAGTGWLNSGLTSGVTYYFVVCSFNSIGNGPNSVQVSAAPH